MEQGLTDGLRLHVWPRISGFICLHIVPLSFDESPVHLRSVSGNSDTERLSLAYVTHSRQYPVMFLPHLRDIFWLKNVSRADVVRNTSELLPRRAVPPSPAATPETCSRVRECASHIRRSMSRLYCFFTLILDVLGTCKAWLNNTRRPWFPWRPIPL